MDSILNTTERYSIVLYPINTINKQKIMSNVPHRIILNNDSTLPSMWVTLNNFKKSYGSFTYKVAEHAFVDEHNYENKYSKNS
jgi:hypothetical protein